MKPVSPVVTGYEQHETLYAKDQPEYQPLPALVTEGGQVLSRWELSDDEMAIVIQTRSIYLLMATFNQPLTPVMLAVENPLNLK
jgi:hypothetical protein